MGLTPWAVLIESYLSPRWKTSSQPRAGMDHGDGRAAWTGNHHTRAAIIVAARVSASRMRRVVPHCHRTARSARRDVALPDFGAFESEKRSNALRTQTPLLSLWNFDRNYFSFIHCLLL